MIRFHIYINLISSLHCALSNYINGGEIYDDQPCFWFLDTTPRLRSGLNPFSFGLKFRFTEWSVVALLSRLRLLAPRVFLVPAMFKLSSVSGGSWILKQLMNTNHIPISKHGWANKWLVRSATLINSSRQPLLPPFSNSQAVQESPRNAFIIYLVLVEIIKMHWFLGITGFISSSLRTSQSAHLTFCEF